jgi:6-phosphogluconolactonase
MRGAKLSFKTDRRRTWGASAFFCIWLLASCNNHNNGPRGPIPPVTTPNVVGLTQAAASTALSKVGLVAGQLSMQSSATVPSGSVISQSPAAGVIVVPGSAVSLAISSGTVAVPNVVAMTQTAAATALTGAGLALGTVTLASSATVSAGSVISQTPAAATMVLAGTAVNLSVSVGPPASFAYVPNAGASTISAYSINAQGQLAPLAVSPIAVSGSKQLYETKIDPTGQFLYVVDNTSPGGIYAFAIQSDGSLLALNAGLPYPTGNAPQSLAFDATGAFLYVLNLTDNSISAFSLNQSTGVLSTLATYPIVETNPNPQAEQIVRAGNFLYVAESATNSVQVFSIAASTGLLTQGVTGSPFATDTGPYSLAANPSGSVLYTANRGATAAGSISAFTVNSSTGMLTPVTAQPLAIPVSNYLSIDPQGIFLFVTENNAVAVYPITKSSGVLGTAVAGPPFAAGSLPYSVGVDLTDQFVYVANDGSANVSEFMLNSSTGVMTPMAGSPVAAGINPDFIAIH